MSEGKKIPNKKLSAGISGNKKVKTDTPDLDDKRIPHHPSNNSKVQSLSVKEEFYKISNQGQDQVASTSSSLFKIVKVVETGENSATTKGNDKIVKTPILVPSVKLELQIKPPPSPFRKVLGPEDRLYRDVKKEVLKSRSSKRKLKRHIMSSSESTASSSGSDYDKDVLIKTKNNLLIDSQAAGPSINAGKSNLSQKKLETQGPSQAQTLLNPGFRKVHPEKNRLKSIISGLPSHHPRKTLKSGHRNIDIMSNLSKLAAKDGILQDLESNLKWQALELDPRVNQGDKLGFLSDVIRVRKLGTHYNYKFTPVEPNGEDNEDPTKVKRNSKLSDVILDDPLEESSIEKSNDYEQWLKSAQLALPSKIGVPIEDGSDLIAGITATQLDNQSINQNPRNSYNQVYDGMQKHFEHKSMAAGDLGQDAERKNIHLLDNLDNEAVPLEKKLASLKVLAEHLTEKRKHKKYLITNGKSEETLISEKETFKANLFHLFEKVHIIFHDLLHYSMIWKTSIDEIHGKFGVTAASYFRWVRTILVMNLVYLIAVLILLVIPEMVIDLKVYREHNIVPYDGCYPPHNSSECPNIRTPFINEKKRFEIVDLFIGGGYFSNSYLFYSGYRDNWAEPLCPIKKNEKYILNNIFQLTAFRFAIVGLVIFVANSVYISLQIIHYYHVARLESRVHGLSKKDHFKVVLCAWDFRCTDDLAAKALHRSIWRELRDLIVIIQKLKKTKTAIKAKGELIKMLMKRFGTKYGALIMHCIINVAVLIICMWAGIVIFYSFYARIFWIQNNEDNKCDPYMVTPSYFLILPAICMTITAEVAVKLFDILSTYETWSSIEVKNFAMFARCGLFYATNMGTLYCFWLYYAYYERFKGLVKSSVSSVSSICYEEKFGQELYRIVVFQGVIQNAISTFRILLLYYKMKKNPKFERPVFDSTSSTLKMFYLHTLCGWGYIFCPLISLLFIIRLISMFYIKKYQLLHYSSFPQHVSHISEVAVPYLVLLFMSYLITSFLNIYLFAEFHASFTCGPFSHFHDNMKEPISSNSSSHYYNVFEEGFNKGASGILGFFTKPGVAFMFIFIILGIVHTMRSWSNGYAVTIENLHELLIHERKDRDFLLKAIYNVVKHEVLNKTTNKEKENNEKDEEKEEVEESTGKKRKSSEPSAWMDGALNTGIFNNRRGSMAGLKVDFNTTEKISLNTTRQNASMFALAAIDEELNEDEDEAVDSSNQRHTVQDILDEAIAPDSSHLHSTFQMASVDDWVNTFFNSKRSKRRSGNVTINLDDRQEINSQIVDDDEDDDEY